MSQTNARSDKPEAAVINDIDALIDEQIDAGQQGQPWPMPYRDRCRHCGGEWHGLAQGGCPGSFAEGDADETLGGPCMIGGSFGELIWPALGCSVVDAWSDYNFELPRGEIGPPAIEFGDLIDHMIGLLINSVLETLSRILGISLADTDIGGMVAGLQSLIDGYDQERQRRERNERIREHLLTYDTSPADLYADAAPHQSYTLADVEAMRQEIHSATDYRRQTVQGLHSGGDHEQAGIGDDERWESCARAAMCDTPAGEEETQQDSLT